MDAEQAVADATFDVEAYVRAPQGPMRDELNHSDDELPAELVSTLHYLQHRLQDTGTWLARVLVTATHKNARMTAFLTTWAYERHWLGDALAAMAGETETLVPARRGLVRRIDSRLGALWAAIIANLYGNTLTGVQMTELLIDSWVLDACLAQLQLRVSTGLAADLGRVRSVLVGQRAFFQEVAAAHLASSAHARRLTHRRLTRRTWPIGAETESAGRTREMFQTLFGTDIAWASRLDAQVDALPGLRGLHLITRSR